MMSLQVCRHAFWAQSALIYGEIVPGFDTDNVIIFYKQIHPALHTAIGAVCRYHLVNMSIGAPATERLVVKVRSKPVNDAGKIFYF